MNKHNSPLSLPLFASWCLFLLLPQTGHSQWERVNTPGPGTLHALAVQQSVVYASGPDGIYKSNTYGLTWEKVYNASNGITHIAANTGAVFAIELTSLKRSVDFGATWSPVPGPTAGDVNMVATEDFLFTWSYGRLRRLNLATEDWDTLFSSPKALSFQVSNDVLWLFSEEGIRKSLDAGDTWTWVADEYKTGYGVVHGDSVLVHQDETVFRSFDAGATWDSLSQALLWYSVGPIEYASGTLYGRTAGTDVKSTDWGVTWDYSTPDGMSDVESIGGLTLLTGEFYGCLRSTDAGTSWQNSCAGIEDWPESSSYLWSFGDYCWMRSLNRISNDGIVWTGARLAPLPSTNILKKENQYYGYTGLSTNKNLIVSDESLSKWSIVPTTNQPANLRQILYVDGHFLGMKAYSSSTQPNVFRLSDDMTEWTGFSAVNFEDNGRLNAFFEHNDRIYTWDQFKYRYSEDGGATWVAKGVSPPGAVFPFYISTSGYEPFTSQNGRLYLLGNNYSIYASDDDGVSWYKISTALEALPEFQQYFPEVEEMFVNDAGIFARIGKKLYLSSDFGISWGRIDTGLPIANNSIVNYMLTNNAMYVQIKYNGYFRLDLKTAKLERYGGTVFLDRNYNLVFDSTDIPVVNALLKSQGNGVLSSSNSSGQYFFYGNYGGDTLSASLSKPYTSLHPAFVVSDTPTVNMDIAVQMVPGVRDLSIELTQHNVLRPGFGSNFDLTYTNNGLEPISGVVSLKLDTELVVVATFPAYDSISGNTYFWKFYDLDTWGYRNIKVEFFTPVETDFGQVLSTVAEIWPKEYDANIIDNTATIRSTVVGSYDPNDKQYEPAHFSTNDVEKGNPIEYTIRFQNTGNFPASFVTILDTLSQKLEPSSLKVLASSHSMTWTLEGQGVVRFRFDEINLPDSTADEPNSHGFVKYSVKADSSLQLGEIIPNHAAIYFDYNLPIITNTTATEIKSPVFVEYMEEYICAGETWGDGSITRDTVLLDTLHYSGFDSVHITYITFLPNSVSSTEASICQGESYALNNQLLTASGSYDVHLTNVYGCDSLFTLHLTVFPSYQIPSDTTFINLCEGQSYGFYGQTLTASGYYTSNLTAQTGCDSIAALSLMIHPVYSKPQDTMLVFVCDGDRYDFWGEELTEPGYYTAMLSSTVGCDSMAAVQLSVLPVYETILDTTVIAGATVNGVVVFADTNLVQHLVSMRGCDSLLNIQVSIISASEEQGRPHRWSISPNPTRNQLRVQVANAGAADFVRLLEVSGKILSVHELPMHGILHLNIADLPSGIYFIQWVHDGGLAVQRVIKIDYNGF